MSDPAMTPEQQQGYNKASEKIEACRRNGGTVLDLSDLGLTLLPPQIGQLTALTELDLDGNPVLEIPNSIPAPTAYDVIEPDKRTART